MTRKTKESCSKVGLTIVHWNVQQFSHAKYTEFKKFQWLDKERGSDRSLPAIVCLTETWLSPNVPDDPYKIDGYKIERPDRSTRGGGLLVYLKDDTAYQYTRCKALEVEELEVIWFTVKATISRPFLVCFIYRKPKSIFMSHFKTMVKKALNLSKEVIILGDLNENVLQIPLTGSTKNLLDFMELHDFKQCVKQPTRVTETSSTLIDHVYCSDVNHIRSCVVLSNSLSDHYPVKVERKINACLVIEENLVTFRRQSKNSIVNVATDIDSLNFPSVFTSNTATQAATALENELRQVINNNMPIVTKCFSVKSNRGNICDVDVPLRKERDRMKRLVDKNPGNSHYMDLYRQLRNRCLCDTRLKIRQKVANQIEKASHIKNQSLKFQCIKSLTNSKINNSISKLSTGNTIIDGSEAIANALNDSFTTISDHYKHHFSDNSINETLITDFVDGKLTDQTSFSIPKPTRHEILFYLKDLKASVSTGLDDISANVVKNSMHALVEPLFYILSKSFDRAEFPDGWKVARVSAIPKDKFFSSPIWENLRPISVLNILSKIGEMHVSKHVVQYFESNHLFHDLQSGSRKFHSCETALLHLTDICYGSLTAKQKTGLVFTDFSKAFDLIDHKLLLQKLRLYRFDPQAIAWFASYLTDRKQVVKIKNKFSQLRGITTGVPQGSILGPLLFLIYTNDMPLAVDKGIVTCCVDDATVICIEPHNVALETTFTSACTDIAAWCQPNHQVLNPTKMAIMPLVGPRTNPPSFNVLLNGAAVSQVAVKKLLGVTIDQRLLFDDQIEGVRQKVQWQLSILRTLAPYCTEDMRLLYYQSFIYPHFIYCSSVWSLKSKTPMEGLLKLQKKAVRLITGSDYLSPSLPLFLKLQIIPIVFQYKINKLILVFKSKKNLTPGYLANKFAVSVSDITGRDTRGSEGGKLFLPSHQPSYAKSFEITGIKMWNSLPQEVRQCCSVQSFRSKLQCFVQRKLTTLSETKEIWCDVCPINHQLECLFCEHFV
jgi:hypothetical protein